MLMLTWRTLLREQPLNYMTQARSKRTCPARMQKIYGSNTVKVTIDATEVRARDFGDPVLARAVYSAYKGTKTVKILVGVSPSGCACFRSQVGFGSVSDVLETKISPLYDLLEEGDGVAADRGFLIADAL